MATRPQVGKRWPSGQEERRVRTIETADDAIRILDKARDAIGTDPDITRACIADAQRFLANIARMMVEAKQGAE